MYFFFFFFLEGLDFICIRFFFLAAAHLGRMPNKQRRQKNCLEELFCFYVGFKMFTEQVKLLRFLYRGFAFYRICPCFDVGPG